MTEQREEGESDQVMEKLADQVAEMMATRKVLNVDVEHTEDFAEAMRERGFKAEVVTGIVGSGDPLKLAAKQVVRITKKRVRR